MMPGGLGLATCSGRLLESGKKLLTAHAVMFKKFARIFEMNKKASVIVSSCAAGLGWRFFAYFTEACGRGLC